MIKYITHISVISLFIFCACRKQDESPSKGPKCSPLATEHISTEIAKFKFKPGSYWVYLDSIHSTTDTMRFYQVEFDGLAGYQYCPDNKYECYSFTVDREYYGRNSYDYYSMRGGRVTVNQTTEEGLGTDVYTTSSSKIDSMFIYDRYYKKVQVYTKGDSKYYFNSDYFLLKREVYNTTNNTLGNSFVLKDKVIVR